MGSTSAKSTAPQIISVGTLLGMIIILIIIGYNSRKMDRLWLLVDIGIIIIAEAVVVVVRSSFVSFMNSAPELAQIYRTTLSVGAKFILNMPTILPTIGAILMVLTHYMTKKKEETEVVGF